MRCKCDVLCEIVVNEKVTSTTLYDVGIKVIKTALIKALGITMSFQRAFKDDHRWAATDSAFVALANLRYINALNNNN